MINGEHDPSLVSALIEGLPEDAMTLAVIRGKDQWHDFLGWTRLHSLLADVYDALNQNTRATGHWRSKPPPLKPYPRPQVKQKRPATVKALYALMTGRRH